MSTEHVKAFYERLAKDKAFKAQIEGAQSKQQCSQIVQEAGYDFTQEEFEEFTAQLLNSNAENPGELSETELETAVGGANYLLPDTKIDFQQMYGLPPDLIDFD